MDERLRAVGAAALVGATVLGAPLLRRSYQHWGATVGERRRLMPGDELVPAAKMASTRAITIGAPPTAVWPWLVQVGQGRGGLYSYDVLEDLVGCDIHSADRILPDHQDLAPGDLIRLGPDGFPCFRVHSLDPDRSLVLVGADAKTLEVAPTPVTEPGATGSTWQWLLEPADDGRSTRLLARQRYTYPRSQSVLWHVVEPIDFVMERAMLRGIRERAERASATQDLRL